MEKVAIICPIKNENTYIHKFFEYYKQHLDSKDIYIIDFGSSEEYLNDVIKPNANILYSNVDILDAPGVFSELKRHQVMLKSNGYDYVISLDVDEILYYHGEGGFKSFLQNLTKQDDIITCNGYEIIHIPQLQEDLKLEEPWFGQLKYWYPNNQHYGKTLISRHQLDWGIGFHKYKINGVWQPDPYINNNLFLIHMHRNNFKTTVDRHLQWAAMKWSADTIKNNYNYHYRMTERAKVVDWYFEPILNNTIYEIPEIIRNLIKI